MSLTTIAILGICIMIVLILLGMNVGMSMVLVGFAGLLASKGWTGALGFLRQVPATQAMTYSFTVIPMFVLMGNAVFRSGVSDGLFDAARKWLSRIPGNLACASVVASAIFGAICGSTIATTATIGTVALPKMRESGYSDKLAAGVICIGGGIGIMIPPSTTMIIYGVATENSIGDLFAAGILPGILMAVLYILAIIVMVKRDPSLAPAGAKCSWAERFRSLRSLVGIVILFLIVLGGMFTGVFTVNEAAAIGALTSLVLMFFRRSFTWKNFYNVIMDTITTSGMVLLLVIGASIFGSFLTVTKLPATLANWLIRLDVSPYVVLLLIIAIYFILGMIMDELPMVMLTIPIFYPVITRLGFDSIWFGVIIVLVTALGNITPPVGVCCFVLSGIAKDIPMATIFRGVWPFVLVLLLTIVILTVFPSIATWLPSLLFTSIT